MQHYILAQVQPTSVSVFEKIIQVAIENPTLALFLISLFTLWRVTRGWTEELSRSRVMLETSQKSGSDQEKQVLDMASSAINKMDRVADSLTEMAQAQRDTAKDYFAAADRIAGAHIETSTLLINRIAAMDAQRAEDEIYSNTGMLRLIDETLTKHKDDVKLIVGAIVDEANTLHQRTREIVVENDKRVEQLIERVTNSMVPQQKQDQEIQETTNNL